MLDVMKAIYDMMGKCTYPILKEETPRQHVDVFFQASVALYVDMQLTLAASVSC